MLSCYVSNRRSANFDHLGKTSAADGATNPNARQTDLAHLAIFYRFEDHVDFSGQQRKTSKVRGVDSDGRILMRSGNSSQSSSLVSPRDGRYDYVVSPKGSLYINTKKAGWTHANILSGRPVQSAGNVWIREGRIVAIDNDSGHYQPSTRQLLTTASGLRHRNLLDDACRIGLPYEPIKTLKLSEVPTWLETASTQDDSAQTQVRAPRRASLTMRIIRHGYQMWTPAPTDSFAV